MTDVSHENLPTRGNGGKAEEWGKYQSFEEGMEREGKKVEIEMSKGKNQGVAPIHLHYPGGWQTQPSRGGPKAPSVAIGSRGSREKYAAPRFSDNHQLFN